MSTIRLKKLEESVLPTVYGKFKMVAYESGVDDFPHLVLHNVDPSNNKTVDVRIHSECLTGDLFGSVRCDCGEQLHQALSHFGEHGGALLYLRQEGRGIGLINKMKAYNLQDNGLDTIKANHALGFPTDERDFGIAISMLKDLGINSINLLTNNPGKLSAFDGTGIEVVERIPVVIDARKENAGYLKVKKDELGHLLS